MKLPENSKFRWNYVVLAFALPMTMMLLLQSMHRSVDDPCSHQR